MKVNILEARVEHGDKEARVEHGDKEARVEHGAEIENSGHFGKISGTDFDFNSIAEAKKNNRGYFDLDEKSKCAIDAAQIIGGKYEQEDEILLASITITNPEEYFRDIFGVMVERNRINHAGTTAAMYYFSPQTGEITTANLGDSRVYLTIKDNIANAYITILLTEDHACDLARIRDHIESNGGRVRKIGKAYRLNNGLALGGAIGDMNYVQDSRDPIVRYPDVTTYNIANLLVSLGISADISECEFTIINASDGLTNSARDNNYDYGVELSGNNSEGSSPSFIIKSNEKGASSYDKEHSHMEKTGITLSKLIERYSSEAREDELSSFLTNDVQTSNARGDNISVSTCSFSGKVIGSEEPGLLGAVFDGHSGHEVSQDCLASLQDFIQAAKKSPSIRIETSNQAGAIDNSSIVNVPSESLRPRAASMRNEEMKHLGAADSELNQSLNN